jgi:hypothetical protein
MLYQSNYNTFRLEMLQKTWDREVKELKLEVSESRNKEMEKELDAGVLEQPIVAKLLKWYLNRCVHQHSLAFFQYRARAIPDLTRNDVA